MRFGRENMIKKLFNELTMCARFALGLKGFVQEKLTFEQARMDIKERLEGRRENFLKLVKKGIFEYKLSPYLPLFKSSNYVFSDVEKMVDKNGIEGALKILKDDGIFFTIQEFKSREKDFDNPYIAACYETRTAGTRSAGTRVAVDFHYFSQVAANKGLMVDAWGLSGFPLIIIRPAFPFGSGMKIMLTLSKFGIYPEKFISPLEAKGLSFRNRLGVAYIMNMGNFFGAKFKKPEYIDFNNIHKIIEIIDGFNKKHGKCLVATNVSSAVRICLAAKDKGIDLKGVVFRGGGEPMTPDRLKVIEERGAIYILSYSFCEAGGAVGFLCTKPAAIDDVHLFKDFLTIISYRKDVSGRQVDAFLATSLLPSAPKILLNVENGDHGVIEDRECGCPYGRLGYNTHIHDIRSFEKLTGEGMTFYGADLIQIMENVLPARFGGSALEYQIVEEKDENGIARLVILVAPAVGPIDENELIKTVLDELGKGNDSSRMMADLWARLSVVKVRRSAPFVTKAGKMYPLHIDQRRGYEDR